MTCLPTRASEAGAMQLMIKEDIICGVDIVQSHGHCELFVCATLVQNCPRPGSYMTRYLEVTEVQPLYLYSALGIGPICPWL
ncbi:hypothetical protein PILCRDRAFT_513505 [Piloderma croceum F 1598]|uniref:Uncharacterized protein n=1 Tax=Piloderma croceum (strain F 1598) TaxID=765440 RepID=A0A0C3FLX2_PILCF|nr:hypothetical protein PILCRDRAFT_513505 [Piloderma croceum F 1598]